jgi:hypothetical protein
MRYCRVESWPSLAAMWRAVWPLEVNSPTLRPASSTRKKNLIILEGRTSNGDEFKKKLEEEVYHNQKEYDTLKSWLSLLYCNSTMGTVGSCSKINLQKC